MIFASFVQAQKQQQTVMILGIDGLNVFRLDEAETPNFDFIRENGAWTYKAQANEPLYSSPNWKSIISGSTPDVHKVLKNGFEKNVYVNDPGCEGELDKMPTIFTMVKRKDVNAKVGVFEHWGAFHKLIEGDNIDEYAKWKFGPNPTVKRGIEFYENENPALVFMHIDHCDRTGHLFRYESKRYLKAVEKADKLLGELIKAIVKKDNFENTTLIVVADHGGKGKTHGPGTVEGMTVPLLIMGPGIKKGHEIQIATKNESVAVLAMQALGIEVHNCWTAKDIFEIYTKK